MALVTGPMASVIFELGKLLNEEYKLQTGVRKKIQTLTRDLESMHANLRKVSKVPPNELDDEVKLWVRDVRELSYNVEDILDTFLVHLERHDEDPDPNKLKRGANKIGKLLSKSKARHKIARMIETINEQAEEVAERHLRYRADDILAKPATTSTVDPRLSAMFREVSQLVGIDKSRDKIISMLSSSEEDDDGLSNKKLKIVSIVGDGGLGKTTLAKAVYDNLKPQFCCGAFVPVGQNPDLQKVLRDILIDLDKKGSFSMNYEDSFETRGTMDSAWDRKLPKLKSRFFSKLYEYDNVGSAECNQTVLHSFRRDIDEKLWRVDALLVASAIMAGVIVGIGAYGQRYRHHPLTRFIFLGATTLFLPIISSVVSSSTVLVSTMVPHGLYDLEKSSPALIALCNPAKHSVLVVTWALLVQNVMINTSVVVAVDDREGQSTGPPIELFVQGIWTLYLGISHLTEINRNYFKYVLIVFYLLELLLFALTVAKLVFKYYAVKWARQSFAFGRNPRLVIGYVHQQLPLTASEHAPPRLLVIGEETRQVEKKPQGYVFKDDDSLGSTLHRAIGLMTLDRVWQQLDSNSMVLPAQTPHRLKDLCLSFALFKLLRCRFARYKLTNAGSETTLRFFWALLLEDGAPERIFGVITDELSFLYDYYYSSLPISYSKCWFPIINIVISLLSIGYCIFLAVWMIVISKNSYNYQLVCHIRCQKATVLHVGILNFDVVPLFLLLLFVIIAEARDIAAHIYSYWTKVVLTCRLLENELSGSMRKWAVRILTCRSKLMTKHWDEKMGQCSVLPLHSRTTPLAFVRSLLHLPDHSRKVDAAVKVAIIDALRSCRNNGGHLSNGKTSLCRFGQLGESLLWACNNRSTSDIMLTWQIATSILEVRYQGSSPTYNHRTVAICLSRYCVYLMIWRPELLPDDDVWSKSRCVAVKKVAHEALSGSSSRSYRQLVQLLGEDKMDSRVIKNGVNLGKQLVETINDEATAWNLLANFWSEMILYVSLSDNLKAHKDSIARGVELITLLWALLNHSGIVSRTSDAASASAGLPVVVI